MLRLQKIIIFSLFTPRFFIRKLMSVVELFLKGGNSLQPTYVEGRGGGEGGSMQKKEWGGGGGAKIICFGLL